MLLSQLAAENVKHAHLNILKVCIYNWKISIIWNLKVVHIGALIFLRSTYQIGFIQKL